MKVKMNLVTAKIIIEGMHEVVEQYQWPNDPLRNHIQKPGFSEDDTKKAMESVEELCNDIFEDIKPFLKHIDPWNGGPAGYDPPFPIPKTATKLYEGFIEHANHYRDNIIDGDGGMKFTDDKDEFLASIGAVSVDRTIN